MSGAYVFIDRSQFPDQVQRDLMNSLHTRVINHKFHYDNFKQAARWLALHEAYSPARQDASCMRIYEAAFKAATKIAGQQPIHLIGLGCGGGQKEASLLEVLRHPQCPLTYTPCDASLPLTLTARTAALSAIADENCHPIVCDLAGDNDLSATLESVNSDARRIITSFGLVPNFDPIPLFRKLAALLGEADILLISANLAPGDDYSAGLRTVLPQYDNPLTREWLFTLLSDLGFEQTDGELRFAIESDALSLQRIVAHYALKQARTIRVFGEIFTFQAGDSIQVFFSYRHTTATIQALLSHADIEVFGQWINESHEEGVFLCRKTRK